MVKEGLLDTRLVVRNIKSKKSAILYPEFHYSALFYSYVLM